MSHTKDAPPASNTDGATATTTTETTNGIMISSEGQFVNDQTTPAGLLRSALAYAARGWPVLPLTTPEMLYMAKSGIGMITGLYCSCDRGRAGEDCRDLGKHPRWSKALLPNGKLSASTDPALIRRWWQEWPNANIGICTGEESGLIAVDMDPKNDGEAGLAALIDEHGDFTENTLTATTGSGGKHFLFLHPGGGKLPGGNSLLAPGIDVKSDGGYIVVAPSLHKSGKHYSWDNPDTAPAICPEWIIKKMQTRNKPTGGNGRVPAGPLAERLVQGQRNEVLFKELCGMRARGMTDAAIRAAADGMNLEICQPPLSPDEVAGIVNSVLTRYEPGTERPHLTDLGNAKRFTQQHGGILRYDVTRGAWLHWGGARWQHDSTGVVDRLAHQTALSIYQETAGAIDKEHREAITKHAVRSEAAAKIHAMLDLARWQENIPVTENSLDADPWLLNCQNGAVDLRTGELLKHDPAMLMTKAVATHFDRNATCPLWEKYLLEIFEGNSQIIEYLQRFLGYCLTGITREQVALFLVGKGSNGKGTLIETLQALGGDYSKSTPFSTFLERRDYSNTSDLASLRGARIVTASEGENKSRFNEPLLKALTGEDPITCRHLYRDYFTYTPAFKILFNTNAVPLFTSQNYAIQRRVHLVPFDRTYYPVDDGRLPQRDETLKRRLLGELPGILGWAVRGCLMWQKGGLNPPEVVKLATKALFESQDPLAEFLEAETIAGPHERIEAGMLWRRYLTWCDARGQASAFRNDVWFVRRMVERDGIGRSKTGGTRYITGLALRQT